MDKDLAHVLWVIGWSVLAGFLWSPLFHNNQGAVIIACFLSGVVIAATGPLYWKDK